MPKPTDNLKTLRRYSTCIFEDLVTPERQRAIDRCIEQNERVMHLLQETAETNPHPNRPMVVDFNLALAALKECVLPCEPHGLILIEIFIVQIMDTTGRCCESRCAGPAVENRQAACCCHRVERTGAQLFQGQLVLSALLPSLAPGPTPFPRSMTCRDFS